MSHNYPGKKTLHYIITGLNVNSAATDIGTFDNLPSKYRVTKLVGFDASTNLTLATVDLRTSSGGGGTAIVSVGALSALTSGTKFIDLTLAVTTDYQTVGTLTVRNVTAQAVAATCSFLLEIIDLS